MSDAAREIENLVYTYAERIDAAIWTALPRCSPTAGSAASRTAHPRRSSKAARRVRKLYEMATRLYDDGTPKTKHFTTNVQLYVDDDAGTARGSAYYCVTQATPDLPLQIIVTGHYRDTFHRIDGQWWFDTRIMFVDQVGDTSHHLKF